MGANPKDEGRMTKGEPLYRMVSRGQLRRSPGPCAHAVISAGIGGGAPRMIAVATMPLRLALAHWSDQVWKLAVSVTRTCRFDAAPRQGNVSRPSLDRRSLQPKWRIGSADEIRDDRLREAGYGTAGRVAVESAANVVGESGRAIAA